jgi:lysophospholipase L1-like esterase
MTAWPLWACAVVGGAGAARLLRLGHDARRAHRYAADAVPFERAGDGAALLVAGDSLSVGVGAPSPERSVAGRLAAACPGVAVVNRARCGARLADVPAQLRDAPARDWDALLLTIGGNDALQGTRAAVLAADAHRAIACARGLSRHVVVASSANLAGVPIFPRLLAPWLEARSRAVRDAIAEACATQGVAFVDFFRPRAADPFGRDPDLYFGPDGVHPSGPCYALCAGVIERRTGLAARLARCGGGGDAIGHAGQKKRPA